LWCSCVKLSTAAICFIIALHCCTADTHAVAFQSQSRSCSRIFSGQRHLLLFSPCHGISKRTAVSPACSPVLVSKGSSGISAVSPCLRRNVPSFGITVTSSASSYLLEYLLESSLLVVVCPNFCQLRGCFFSVVLSHLLCEILINQGIQAVSDRFAHMARAHFLVASQNEAQKTMSRYMFVTVSSTGKVLRSRGSTRSCCNFPSVPWDHVFTVFCS